MKNKTRCELDSTLTIADARTGRQESPDQTEMFDGNEGHTAYFADEDGMFRMLANNMYGLNLKPGEQTPWGKYAVTNPVPQRSDQA